MFEINVGGRIRHRRKQLKYSVDKLAEMIGKNRATVYRYESNEIENMPFEILEPLAKALKVSPAYLMGWEEKDNKELLTEYNYFPVSISAGLPSDVDSMTDGDVEKVRIPDAIMGKWAGDTGVYLMKVNGESMNKIIPHGSMIAVKYTELQNLKDGDIVVYSHNNEYSVKRFYTSDEKLIFRPDSYDKSFTDHLTSSDSSDLVIHGKVVVYIVTAN
ncbi:LexA family protein [Salipaludibacillus sp. HK11]|uniref:LexA family protein n=1 Tax=Salipaludibacillus sp. HK11 TaxID=3394320 RepID=UPI0039FC6C54